MQISYVVQKIINVKIKEQYKDTSYQLNQAVGTGRALIARTGVRGSNDLVWVGRAASGRSQTLWSARRQLQLHHSEDVLQRLNEKSKYGGDPTRCGKR